MKPKLIIDLSGGLVQSIVTDTDIDVFIIDYDDPDETGDPPGRIMLIDGEDLAYVFRTDPVEVNPERANDLFAQIETRLKLEDEDED